MLKKSTFILLPVLVSLIWISWPIYQLLAHQGKVAMPPFGFTQIPVDNVPEETQLFNSKYAKEDRELKLKLAEYREKLNAPAISAAVSIDGSLVWAGVSGWSDIENDLAATTQTVFRIGSTSKALTNIALARMVEKSLIDLDEPISTYIPDLPNTAWNKITPRQLASHMSGLPHYSSNNDILGFYHTAKLKVHYQDVIQSLEVFDSADLLFEPGTAFSYSSYGTVLLSAVMQKAYERPFHVIMQNEVFGPAQAFSTAAEWRQPNKDNLAKFYWNNKGKSREVRLWRPVNLSHRLAGGGFTSTPVDLVNIANKVMDDSYLSQETRDTFWTPQQQKDGLFFEQGNDKYALGWRKGALDLGGEHGLITVMHHGGVTKGAQSFLLIVPAYKMAIAINMNANTERFWDFGRLSQVIATIFLDS